MYVTSFSAGIATIVNSLEAKNAREAWEKEFNVLYIQPVLADLDNKVNEAMDLIANDDKQGEHLCKLLPDSLQQPYLDKSH